MLFSCDSHSVSQPSMQYEQCPHALPSHAMATRSPALCGLAPGPVASTMPTPSCPGMNGGFGLTGQSPAAAWMSVWHSPEVCIRTSTCPGPGSGTGSSLISSLAPSSGTTAAFIVCMTLPPGKVKLVLSSGDHCPEMAFDCYTTLFICRILLHRLGELVPVVHAVCQKRHQLEFGGRGGLMALAG